jgi:aspartyl-tRNA(Asn)/glutamyl-tRNA(Gln) amidotransferase subunit B
MEYEVIIGLEIHVELLTESKMFCGCSTFFGEEPNTQTCPVCLGLPGALPVMNEKAIIYTVKTGLALNSEIAGFSQFHRKNYFYPDMSKNYQISQYDFPLCSGGHVDVEMDEYTRRVGITRVHLEEDTGKLIHRGGGGRIAGADYSIVDFNRCGVPLMEIVTEPDIRTPEEAKAFMQKLKSILQHLEVSDCNMEQGSLRCDANVSIRPREQEELGVKTEVKNMNSFKALQRALAYEIERQEEVVATGGKVEQETRHWDAEKNITTSLRTKEYAHDYRYFPDPDLVPMHLQREKIRDVRKTLPELPDARRKRFAQEYELPAQATGMLTSAKASGDFFEQCMEDYHDAKNVCNWITGELAMHLNAADLDIDESAVTPKHLVQLLKMIDDGTISGKIAKNVFDEMFETGKLPQIIVEEKGLTQISDAEDIAKIIDMVIEENRQAANDYREGQEKALGFLVGQVMRLTKGRANPGMVNGMLKDKLGMGE